MSASDCWSVCFSSASQAAAIAKSSDLNLAPLPFSIPISPLSGSILRPLKQQGGSQVLGLIFASRLHLKGVFFCCCCSNFSVLMALFGNGLFLSGSAHLEKAGSRSLCIFTSQEPCEKYIQCRADSCCSQLHTMRNVETFSISFIVLVKSTNSNRSSFLFLWFLPKHGWYQINTVTIKLS